MSLSTYGYIVGAALALIGVAALTIKEILLRIAGVFPRNVACARLMTALVLGWTAFILFDMPLGWFEPYKNSIYLLAPLLFFIIVVYLDELLAPRMLGVLLILAAAPVLDEARWHDSAWRLLLVSIVYVWVVWGMVLVLNPYRFRQTVQWWSRNDRDFRNIAWIVLGLGVLILALALFVY